MKILVGRTFGLGNAICIVPLLKALRLALPDPSLHQIDVLIGDTPDDVGASDVFETDYLRQIVQHRVIRSTPVRGSYGVAIMGTPYDGRWQNGVHFEAMTVWDGRPRPDPSTTGFSSWEKHEVEYLMENAHLLGFKGEIPSCQFLPDTGTMEDRIYVGMGYKRDPNSFWKQKHWGNEKYASLIKMLLREYPTLEIYTSGDARDFVEVIGPVTRMVNDRRFRWTVKSMRRCFDLVSSCRMYVGNDTGMMHVAASFDRMVIPIFRMDGAHRKSYPWTRTMGNRRLVLEIDRDVSPEEMFGIIKETRDGIG